jgi:hypothetical protein
MYRAGVRSPALGALWCFGGTAMRSMSAISIPAEPASEKRSRLSGSKSETDHWPELVSL